MTLPLKHPWLPDPDALPRSFQYRVQQNFETISLAALDTGGRGIGIRNGSVTVTWPGGAALSTIMTVTHGLGKTPVSVVATPNSQAGTGVTVPYIVEGSIGATSFQVRLETNGGFAPLNTATTPTSWIAIG